MEALVHLLVVVVAALVLGRAALRMGQSASVGEILAGALIAVAVGLFAGVPYLSGLPESRAIDIVGDVGIFALLLLAGIEMNPREIAEHSRESLAVAFGGMALPLASGFALAWLFIPESGLKTAQALVVGTGLAISSVPVATKVFMELGLLHRPVGEIVISAAVFDDVLGFIVLAVVTTFVTGGQILGFPAFALLLAKLVLFFLLTAALGLHVFPRLWRLVSGLHVPGLRTGILLAIALSFSLLAVALGMHFVLGPFVAGLFFDGAHVGDAAFARTKHVIGALTLGFLGPIFFASIGLRLDPGAIATIPGFLAALILIAFAGKLIGAGLPAYWAGLDRRHALAVGVGMSGRGAIELVVASIAEKAGVFASADGPDPIVGNLFSALVLTAVITTLLTPVLLRWVLAGRTTD